MTDEYYGIRIRCFFDLAYSTMTITPTHLFHVLARLGGMATVLGALAVILRAYNIHRFTEKYGLGIEFNRLIRVMELVEKSDLCPQKLGDTASKSIEATSDIQCVP